jgi:ABC-type antimicrobial peptide transport system permease subunit
VHGVLLKNQLFGLAAFDPWSVALALAVMGVCAFIASALPARRAAATEPMQALRAE